MKGIALSGIAAQNLQEQSGIKSRTIASFSYAVAKEKFKITEKDIIILDEAGMTDTYSLVDVLETVHQAKAKLVLVGDDAQLQPIGPGAPFRALIESCGFAKLENIVRQEKAWQRQATHDFSTGNVKEALATYNANNHIHFSGCSSQAMSHLIEDWQKIRAQGCKPLSKTLILAHTNKDVAKLNTMARSERLIAGEIEQGVFLEQHEIWVSKNDRILFQKNDAKLDVKNGQFGTIKDIKTNDLGEVTNIDAELDNKKQANFNPNEYMNFTYGYAATIHKAQGITTDRSFLYLGDRYWNRNLLYVAASRHRKTLDMYVNQSIYPDLEALSKGVERDGTKDNILDFPLNFARRRGFESESLFHRFKEHALGYLKTAVKFLHDKYQQIINYPCEKSLDKKSNLREQPTTTVNKLELEIDKIHANLEKLHADLIQAKQQKEYYSVHRLKRQFQKELRAVSKNKKLYQAIQDKSPKFYNLLQKTLAKESEFEI